MSTTENASNDTSKGSDGNLLDALERTPDEKLTASVSREEGIEGSTLVPVYGERRMVMYSVTETELQTMQSFNSRTTSYVGVGSAMITFSLDIFKDTLLATSVPEKAQAAISYVQPICVTLGVIFFVLAAYERFKGWNFLKTIKRENQRK